MEEREWQFDGLVGPTHNYAGLATGNLASATNAGKVANPRLAALQGLEKMLFVRNLGMNQAFLPPHYRPLVSELSRLGFKGKLGTVLEQAFNTMPGLLASVFSSSFMWAANAATVSPSSDTGGTLHITPANLLSHYHRNLEVQTGSKILKNIFHNKKLFTVHDSLPTITPFGDEGAANHMRISDNVDNIKINIFVFGSARDKSSISQKFGARQEYAASEALARLHDLELVNCMFLQQNPAVIDQGVFHNDVIAMNTGPLMIAHCESLIQEDQMLVGNVMNKSPHLKYREVTSKELTVKDAVDTYLFNSQLLQIEEGRFVLVAPSECSNHAGAAKLIHKLIEENYIQEVHYLDVRESMRNGGGPACLRLRIVLTPEQEQALHPGVVLTDSNYAQLKTWIETHYRDRLSFHDLKDPEFIRELDAAYEALEPILGMPGLYDEWRIARFS